MPLYQKHVDMYRLRHRADRKPHAAAIYDSEIKGDPSGSRTRESERDRERARETETETERENTCLHSTTPAACVRLAALEGPRDPPSTACRK